METEEAKSTRTQTILVASAAKSQSVVVYNHLAKQKSLLSSW